jgi:acetyl esterase
VRDHASELGIDPSRIAAGGGSAGGHLAIVCALLNDGKINEEFLPPPHPSGSRPDGLVLFNPLLDFDIPAVHQRTTPSQRENLKAISPLLLLDSSLPPALILHGTADNIIPIKTSEAFVMAADKAGVKTVKLVRYPGKGHEFYLHGPGSREAFETSMVEVSEFLTELGWAPDPATN